MVCNEVQPSVKLERKIHVIPNKLVWLYVQPHTSVEKNDARSQATAVLLYIHVAVISINSSTQKQKKGLTNYFYLTEYLQQSNAESPFVLSVQQRKHLMFKHIYIYIHKEFITILDCKTYKVSF